ncbi:MAG: sugar ABC transporter permease [Acidibacillus sp.]|uniref:Lactose transport system permease protein LacF n=1 Tax=Sulfoacidibacillus ferrooxidans TaxID=2005001 RepID=A0A9X1V975_9BACL|nr:sugar ABC transporter permease [Sulfoacidibacillus ferrooxidans]MCI0182428.1 Lactose transport system permease protein LacF [Sulfoacidibacillus ferrooxidans]MCY0893604.1 sugar ABC transporter permease [Acidibacillus sp.]
MKGSMVEISDDVAGSSSFRRKRFRISRDRISALATLAPSIILLGIFVYGFIVWTVYVSFTNWNSFIPNFSFAGLKNYLFVFETFRFQSDLRNIVVFTILFIIACIVIGLFLAMLIDQKIKAESLFRSIFIFPMAVSFVVTGVIWSWILNPQTGVNLILKAMGFKHLPSWFLSTTIIPNITVGQIQLGIPLALLAVLIAAVWEMSGFAMAVYLAGLRGISDDIKEAARIDGAGSWRIFWSIILPQLKATTTTVVIILTAASLKIFGLIYAMTGPGQEFVTDMPSMDMFQTTFQGNEFAQGAAISVVLLIIMAAFIVPYLISTLKQGEDE